MNHIPLRPVEIVLPRRLLHPAIDGTNPFRLAGANLAVPDGDDESLALYAKDGVSKVADIVVTETDGGQQITCKLDDSAAVPKGTYKVRLASHGLDPTDPLTVATLTVTLVEPVPAPTPSTLTNVAPSHDEDAEWKYMTGCGAVVKGTNPSTADPMKIVDCAGVEHEIPLDESAEQSPARLVFAGVSGEGWTTEGDGTVKVKGADGAELTHTLFLTEG